MTKRLINCVFTVTVTVKIVSGLYIINQRVWRWGRKSKREKGEKKRTFRENITFDSTKS